MTHLDGIQQFINLRAFSAADNFLPSFPSVAPLQALSATLEAVSLEGNPVVDLPNYRARMITMLSEGPLHQLDGKPVTTAERQTALAQCAIEEATKKIAFNNFHFISRLKRALQTSQLHRELHTTFEQHRNVQIDLEKGEEGTPDGNRMNGVWKKVEDEEDDQGNLFNDAETRLIEASITTQATEYHTRMLLGDASSSLFGSEVAPLKKQASFQTWHRALCRVIADQMCSIEEMLTTAAGGEDNTKNTGASGCVVSLRQVVQELSRLDPGKADSGTAAHCLCERVSELLRDLLVNTTTNFKASSDLYTSSPGWKIAALPSGERDTTKDMQPLPNSSSFSNSNTSPMTLAAQHTLALEEQAKLKLALQHSESSVADLRRAVESAQQEAAAAVAASSLSRREQTAAQEAVVALQGWLTDANTATEKALKSKEKYKAEVKAARQCEQIATAALETEKEEKAELEIWAAALRQQLEELQTVHAKEQAAVVQQLQNEVVNLNGKTAELSAELEKAKKETAAAAAFIAASTQQQEQQQKQQQPVILDINIFFAQELEEERKKSTLLTAQLTETQAETLSLKAEIAAEQKRQESVAAEAKERKRLEKARKEEREGACNVFLALQSGKRAAAGFAKWRLAAHRCITINAIQHERASRGAVKVLRRWQMHTRAAVLLRALDAAAAAAASLNLTRRALLHWRKAADLHRQVELLPEESSVLATAAFSRTTRTVKNVFSAWKEGASAEASDSHALILLKHAEKEAACLQNVLQAWRTVTDASREAAVEARTTVAARKVILLRATLATWKRQTRRSAALDVHQSSLLAARRSSLLARCLSAWLSWHTDCTAAKEAARDFEEMHSLEVQRHALCSLVSEQKAELRARGVQFAVLRHTFSAWRSIVQSQRRTAAVQTWILSSQRRDLCRKVVACWKTGLLLIQVDRLSHTIDQLESLLRGAHAEILEKERMMEAVQQAALHHADQSSIEIAENKAALSALHHEISKLQSKLSDAEAHLAAAQQESEKAMSAAQSAAEAERHAWEEERTQRHAAATAAIECASTAAAASDVEVSRMKAAWERAEQRAASADEDRVTAEMLAMEALESAESASAACDRLSEECAGLREALGEARHVNEALRLQLDSLCEEMNTRSMRASEAVHALQAEAQGVLAREAALKKELAVTRRRWQEAEEARGVAESDAQVAVRQAQRLGDMLEQQQYHHHRYQ